MPIAKKAPSLKSSQKWFKTPLVSEKPGKVDRVNGIIYDAVLAQVGPAEGHGTNVEQQFIDELVTQGNKAGQGIKIHFGHPSMSEQTLGTFTGRAKNLSVRGEQAIGDIHLSQAAIKSPKGDLYNYLLDMAEKEGDIFGMSVVTSGNWCYQYDDEGNMYTENDEDWFDKYTSTRPLYEMFESFLDVDFVDRGALTPGGLFSIEMNMDKFAVAATSFLDNNVKIDGFLKTNPLKMVEFLSKRYGVKLSIKEEKSIFDTLTELFSKSKHNKMSKNTKTPKEIFDINAVTDQDVELVIVTSDSVANEGDQVLILGTEESPEDGDYTIDTSDDDTLTGKVMTIQGGTISSISDPAATADTTATGAKNKKSATKPTEKKTLEERFSAMEEQFNAMSEENEELKEEVKVLRKRPKTAHSSSVKGNDGFKSVKTNKKTSYNSKAEDLYNRTVKRTAKEE